MLKFNYCNELDKSELIFKYFCSTDVIMSWKAALNWNCLDFRMAASTLSHYGMVWMAEQGAQLCKNSPSPKIHQIQLCWPLSPVWYNCMSTAWISSHFCKCKSQVNPLKRGLNSGKQGESEANSSLCWYSVKIMAAVEKQSLGKIRKKFLQNCHTLQLWISCCVSVITFWSPFNFLPI